MIRVHLTEEQRPELKQLTRTPGLAPRTRERLEMVRLADAGWSIPRIARHLQAHPQTVRYWIKRFRDGGFAGLPDQLHPGRPGAITPAMLDRLRQEMRTQPCTWTARQITAWLAEEYGVCRSVDQVREVLRQANLSYKRTHRSLKHKQKETEVARAQAELAVLKKGERPVAGSSGISMR